MIYLSHKKLWLGNISILIICFREERLTGFVQHKLGLEENLHADARVVRQHGGDKGQEGLWVAVVGQVMLPDLDENVHIY